MLGRRLLTIILTTIVPTVLLNVISYATNHFKAFFFEALFLAWISLTHPDHHCSAQAYQLHLQGNRHSQLDGNAGSDHIVYRGELSEVICHQNGPKNCLLYSTLG